MEKSPLVTVIALSYNHEQFVVESLQSVLDQTYANVELIVVDDASTDNSQQVIADFIADKPEIKYLPLSANVGNCKAFNIGLKAANGEFIIDLATDDVLLPTRIEQGLASFSLYDDQVGVNFCNANILNEDGQHIKTFYPIDSQGKTQTEIPQGNLYAQLVARYFICPPTMMSRKTVFDSLAGYDENLLYEDFDFWVRSARQFDYCFTNEILVNKRELSDSLSAKQYKPKSEYMRSTFEVCEKILKLNKNNMENLALRQRIYYEMYQCVKVRHYKLAFDYVKLLLKSF